MSKSVLFNYMLLSTEELQNLFWQLSSSFVEGLDRKPIEELQEIRNNLKVIVEELRKRQTASSLLVN